jgi:hypothetical protein
MYVTCGVATLPFVMVDSCSRGNVLSARDRDIVFRLLVISTDRQGMAFWPDGIYLGHKCAWAVVIEAAMERGRIFLSFLLLVSV